VSERETIEDVIRRMVLDINRHDTDACIAYYSETADLQDPRFPDPVRGREYVREGFAYFFSAFPDVEVTVSRILCDGTQVAVEWVFEATHRGEYLGVPGSGVRFRVLTAAHFTVEDGRITRDFSLFDATGLKLLQDNAAASSGAGAD
jgi:steroid delta-isomerase-like uncharacterized protein